MPSRTPACATARCPASTQAGLGRVGERAHRQRLALARVLLDRAIEPVRQLDGAALQVAHELVVVIADDGECLPAFGHVHDDTQHVRGVGPAVDQIADEKRSAASRRRGDGAPVIARSFEAHRIAELAEQCDELVGAAVHVADDVERPAQVAPVGGNRLRIVVGRGG
jgi:hypothetical protein